MVLGIILLIISYLIGSIPCGYLLGKSVGIDIRKEGSGNIGSTNATRTLGKKLGFLAWLGDVLKGMLIILIVYLLEATTSWTNPFVINGDSLYILYGMAAVIGHVFPIYLKFKGGKAVSTSLGAILALFPLAVVITMVVFGVLMLTTGIVSLTSSIASLVACVSSIILYGTGLLDNKLISTLLTIVLFIIIIIKHIPNYKRLIEGTEYSFKNKKLKD